MTAPVPTSDFRHLSLWPASGARYGDVHFSRDTAPAAPRPKPIQTADHASPAEACAERWRSLSGLRTT